MRKQQEGFGLIEVMVALIVLGLMVSAIAPIMKSSVWGVENTLARNSARFKAERILDSLQVTGIHSVASNLVGFDCTEDNIDKRDFSCTVEATTMDSYGGEVVSKGVTVTVSWDITGTSKSISVEGVVQ